MRRMDRYNDENTVTEKRSYKNQDLYQSVVNTKQTDISNISDVASSNAFEIQTSDGTKITSREKYHQMKKYQNIEPVPRVKKELDDFNYLYKDREKKIYDINSVLEEARKNRKEQDELEAKRKLKNTSYNILADLNKEELEKYREEKRKRSLENHETSELRELIDTITTKTLAGEIDQETSVNLLSDLMATNIFDKVKNPEEIDEEQEEFEKPQIIHTEDITDIVNKTATDEEEIEEIASEEKEEETEEIASEEQNEETTEMTEVKEIYDNIEENLTKSQNLFNKTEINEALEKEEQNKELEERRKEVEQFYTKSLDLSDEDIDMSDDFKEKKLPIGIKIGIFLLVAAIVAVTIYFIYLKLV